MITTASVLAAFFVLLMVGSIIGEAIATMSPFFFDEEVESLGLEYESVAFPTSDGLTLRGWFFPADNPKAPAILYAPATSHDQRQGLSLVAPLRRAGFHVLLFSYRGHGVSDGSRFDFSYGARESRDVDAAVNYLYEQRGIHQIGAIGHSAGAASIILSAARNPRLGAVVAAASFSSIEETWLYNRPQIYPKPLYNLAMRLFELRKRFSRHQVRPLDVIGQIAPRPIMLIYGHADQRIPAEQAMSMYIAASHPKRIIWLPDVTHAQVRSPGLDRLAAQITRFFSASLRSPAYASK